MPEGDRIVRLFGAKKAIGVLLRLREISTLVG
jgi:hypothetical protein